MGIVTSALANSREPPSSMGPQGCPDYLPRSLRVCPSVGGAFCGRVRVVEGHWTGRSGGPRTVVTAVPSVGCSALSVLSLARRALCRDAVQSPQARHPLRASQHPAALNRKRGPRPCHLPFPLDLSSRKPFPLLIRNSPFSTSQ